VVEEIKAPIACNQVEYHVSSIRRLRKYLAAKSIPLVVIVRAQGRWRPTDADGDRRNTAQRGAGGAKWLLDQDAWPRSQGVARRNQKANLGALNVGSTTRTSGIGPAKDRRWREPGFPWHGLAILFSVMAGQRAKRGLALDVQAIHVFVS